MADGRRLKAKKNYKLVSRILFLNYHLSGMPVTRHLFLPTLPGKTADKFSNKYE
jgi:hypothetical protein